jgi:O-antigen/teichoic acid export membrane protein
MINIKEHFKLTFLYTFFGAFPAVLQLIVYPIIEGVDRLGAEDFGYLAITEATISFSFLFIVFGMSVAIARFYYDYAENKEPYKKLIATVFTGLASRAVLLIGIALLISPFIGRVFNQVPLQQFISYGPFLVIIAFNRAIVVVALSLYRNEKKLKYYVLISFLSGLLRTAFQLIGVFMFDMSFLGYIYGTAIGSSLVSITLIVLIWVKYGLRIDSDINKSLNKFSFSLVFNDFLFWGILFLDRFFLLKDPVALGIYDNAMKFALGIQLITQGLANAVQPEVFRYFKEGLKKKENEIKSLSHLFVIESISIITLSIIPIIIFIDFFYETDLKLSTGIVSLVLMRFILNSVYQALAWPVIYLKKTSTFFVINSLVLIILVVFNIILVPIFGYYGSIAAFQFAAIFQIILLYRSQQKICFISWNKLKILYLPIGIVLLTSIFEFIKVAFNINLYIINLLLVAIIFLSLILIYKTEINGYIKKYLLTKI